MPLDLVLLIDRHSQAIGVVLLALGVLRVMTFDVVLDLLQPLLKSRVVLVVVVGLWVRVSVLLVEALALVILHGFLLSLLAVVHLGTFLHVFAAVVVHHLRGALVIVLDQLTDGSLLFLEGGGLLVLVV